MLARRWDRARGGEGQLVLVVGEPGLGKSPASKSSMAALRRPRTPGLNGARRNFCRTRRCIRSENGAGNALAWMLLPISGSPISRARCD